MLIVEKVNKEEFDQTTEVKLKQVEAELEQSRSQVVKLLNEIESLREYNKQILRDLKTCGLRTARD